MLTYFQEKELSKSLNFENDTLSNVDSLDSLKYIEEILSIQ